MKLGAPCPLPTATEPQGEATTARGSAGPTWTRALGPTAPLTSEAVAGGAWQPGQEQEGQQVDQREGADAEQAGCREGGCQHSQAAHHPSPGRGRAVPYSPSYTCLRLRHVCASGAHATCRVHTKAVADFPTCFLVFSIFYLKLTHSTIGFWGPAL